jgi:BirA family biotin operon repressor/biotin-[acetyl-CoA-carboxylase] ligase
VLPFLGQDALLEIKWPNDLIADGRKVCGILCETRGGLTAVGIGLNVNGKAWPLELEGRAASLEEVAGSPLDRGRVLEAVVLSLEQWFARYLAEGFGPVRERFLEHGMLKEHVLATEDGQPCAIADMGEDGHLVLDVSGSLRELVSGTIVLQEARDSKEKSPGRTSK